MSDRAVSPPDIAVFACFATPLRDTPRRSASSTSRTRVEFTPERSSFTTFTPVVIQQRFWAQNISSSSLVAAPSAPPLRFPPPSLFHCIRAYSPPPPSGNFDTYPMQRFRFPNAAILQLLPPSSQQHSLTLSAVAPSSLRSFPRLSSPPIPLQSLILRHLASAVIVVRISELVSLFRDLLVPISRTSCLGVDTYRASFSALSPGVPPTSSFHHSGDPVTCTFIHTILLPFLALGTSTRAPFHLE
ncbi:hypothetical protein C8R45DRAFT_1029228, partial [Mycena sanguinolenta]